MTGKPKVSHHVPGNLATTKTGQLLGGSGDPGEDLL